ncbi:RNA polymerase sigma-70 factor (ECF subfamily) [Actinoplanes lutulentus]|uniref:RNA polymerase sigma-70 factor (ECF subfamily) n=1 Tax=Actinoplanes lutulentus TaxID=1287878 RepID=A0A327YUW0_9ACTN|nr:sigma-70 family RNA polymerase sigma factor [Actinoplanes lutulentus]MBB2946474.1 RNA polymerase sigma-70 factor (ECF subfamily) [Actinoplanes lutulentus]RAK24756.1 RNA polymerase sigma-70 factor (ECF subfamily) [Actinoplanes lutulentus]
MRELHRDNGGALLHYLRRLTPPGSPCTAEDLVQETMLRAWRNLDQMPAGPEPQRRWLFTVARHLAIDAYRKRQTRPAEVGLADTDLRPSVNAAAETAIASLTLRRAVGELGAAHRSVLLELYVNGHSIGEVADRLGLPVGTVKSRAHYGVRHLRNALMSH